MPAAWRTVRVLISSTFRDMHAERNYLVKVVVSALRERLEKHRIHLIDVDLRWGITEEEAQQDRVLALCLELIDECRPCFVGILGERYGWVPKSFSEEVVSKYGWVQYQTGKSVTELESLYGVLHDPKMRGHEPFFFRDPGVYLGLCREQLPLRQGNRPGLVRSERCIRNRSAEMVRRVFSSYWTSRTPWRTSSGVHHNANATSWPGV